MRGPSAVTATVCSQCADRLPSREVMVQPSSPSRTSGPPTFTIGSMAMTQPSRSSGPNRSPVVRHLRLLVHRPPTPCPTRLRTPRTRRPPPRSAPRARYLRLVADDARRDAAVEGIPGDGDELLRDGRDGAHPVGAGGVGDPPVEHHADVHRDDVTVVQLTRPGDAVHHLVVDRGADGSGEAVVALEGGRPALAADELSAIASSSAVVTPAATASPTRSWHAASTAPDAAMASSSAGVFDTGPRERRAAVAPAFPTRRAAPEAPP